MNRILPLVALLTACGQQSPSAPANEAATPPTATESTASTVKAFAFDKKNDLIDFHYGWSAEAAAVPQLVARFRKEMEKTKAELIASANEDKALQTEDFNSNAYNSSTDYSTAGESPRLLSLSVGASANTGGAHGNFGTSGLLWDRQAVKEIEVADLFAAPANLDRLLTQRWCDALNKEREENRGEPVGGDGLFNDCPKFSDIAIVPTDKDGDGRFERLVLTASPYVAGPYVEGSYEVDLRVTPDLIAALKAEYRDSFRVAQPQ